MKILFITNNLPPIVDGVGDYTYNIAKQFVKHNHKVYIICRNDSQIDTTSKNITILPIIEKWNINCCKSIVTLIKKETIDIVSLQYVPHGFHPKGLPFPIIKLTKEIKKCDTKLFTFFHEVGVEKEKGNIKKTILSILMQYISKKIIENSDYTATSIEYYKNMMLKLVPYKGDIPLIPIASNVPETKLSKEELFNLKKELAPKNETIISFFGIRNIQTSIDAISELKNEGYKLKVLLIGKTSNNLPQNLPHDSIKTGTLNIEEIDKYFKVSDIFILPAGVKSGCAFKSGSLSTAIVNLIPIISNKGIMTSSRLQNKTNIIFSTITDKNSIKKNILELITNKVLYNNIKSNMLNLRYEFSWDKTYEKYINILNI